MQKNIDLFNKQREPIADTLKSLEMKIPACKKSLQQIESEISQKMAKLESVKTESEESMRRKAKSQGAIEHYKKSKFNYEERYEFAFQNYRSNRAELDEFIAKCLETWDRVPVTKSVEDIEKLVVEVKAHLEQKEQQ